MNNTCIILFVKAPEPGLVKTRLAADTGDEIACEWYKTFTQTILAEIRATGAACEIHYTPPEKSDRIKHWLGPALTYVPQTGITLGDKMKNAMARAFDTGYDKVIITGSDIPDLTCAILVQSFEAINHTPVIGPCIDGGYYLIGADRSAFDPSYFTGIPWSTPAVLETTLKKMASSSLFPVLMPPLNDIDTLDDLIQYQHQTKTQGSTP